MGLSGETEGPMSESPVEGGGSLAWRLLATLEGGSLVLAASALLAYTARSKMTRGQRKLNSVLISNTSCQLGEELRKEFEAHGCTVHTVTGGATRGAEVDALVIVGAEAREGLEGVSDLVTKDVYDNLKLLDSLASRVRRGGSIAWACAGATRGSFSAANAAFDSVLRSSLETTARNHQCEPVWVGRTESGELTAQRLVAALLPCTTHHEPSFSIRNAAYKVSGYIGRWLKIIS